MSLWAKFLCLLPGRCPDCGAKLYVQDGLTTTLMWPGTARMRVCPRLCWGDCRTFLGHGWVVEDTRDREFLMKTAAKRESIAVQYVIQSCRHRIDELEKKLKEVSGAS